MPELSSRWRETLLQDSLTITQSIDIDAACRQVWDVLANLATHHDWNPTFRIENVPADLQVAAQARLCAAPDTPQERVFTIKILAVTVPTVLVWQGGEPEIFEGIHRFELQALATHQTRLVNSESFSGQMIADILQTSRALIEQEFAAFNQALKQRVTTLYE